MPKRSRFQYVMSREIRPTRVFIPNVQELRLGLLRVLNRLRAWINRSRLVRNLRAQYDLAEVSGSVFLWIFIFSISCMMPKRSRFEYVRSRETRPTRVFNAAYHLQRIIRYVLRLRKMMRIMIKELTWQSWAGDVPNYRLAAFMSDGSGSFHTAWRNRGRRMLRFL